MDGDIPQSSRVQQALDKLLANATPIEPRGSTGRPSIVINGNVTIKVVMRQPRRP